MTVITIQLPGSPGSPGPKGDPGPLSVMTIDPDVVTGAPGTNATATITGVAPNQIMHLTVPRGATGAQGDPGVTPTLASGTINTGAPGTNVVATLTGTAPNYLLNLTIPRGATGNTGPANTISIGTVTAGTLTTDAAATLTGTAPNQTLNLVLPRGLQGDKGDKGDTGLKGDKGDQGLPGIPGSASGAGTGVPLGGLTGELLGKLSNADFDHGWLPTSTTAVANSIVKRDANGRAVMADPSALNEIATKQSSEAAADSRIATHAALTLTHGVTGAIVGTTNTQTLTNKTLTTPTLSSPGVTDFVEMPYIAVPATPATGKYRFFVDTTTKRWSQRDELGFVNRYVFSHGRQTLANFPGLPWSGEVIEHNPTGLVFISTPAGWRPAGGVVPVASATARTALNSSLGSLLYDGFTVYETDTDRMYTWDGVSLWRYIGGGTDPSTWQTVTYTNGWMDYDTGYGGVKYRKLANGMVTMKGLMKSGTIGATAFTLPAGYRPINQLLFCAQTNPNVAARFDISTTGATAVIAGDSGWVSMACSFLAEQ